MEILGYSERGAFTSLIYEMKYSDCSLGLLGALLSLAWFPFRHVTFRVTEANILLEQSFSQFGVADMVLLLENNGKKQAVFVEAKVRAWRKLGWKVADEFKAFRVGVAENKVSSSNVFAQLYHKVRILEAIRSGGVAKAQKGVDFPQWSSRPKRKLGSNKVVVKAANKLAGYCDDALFIALVPDTTHDLQCFCENTLKGYSPDPGDGWDTRNWGFLAWQQVKEFCEAQKLTNTLKVFRFNKGQIL